MADILENNEGLDKPPIPPDAGQTNSNHCKFVKQDPQTIVVNTPAPIFNVQVPKVADGWTIGNKIAFSSVIVTAILIVVTYCLFSEAQKQTIAANRAAIVADSALDVARKSMNSSDSTNRAFLERATQSADAAKNSANALNRADSTAEKNYKLTRDAFENSKIENKKRSAHDSATLQAQIALIGTAQKDFELANRPFIQIDSAQPPFCRPGKKTEIKFTFFNKGKFPAKLLFYRGRLFYGPSTTPVQIIEAAEYQSADSIHEIIGSGSIGLSLAFVADHLLSDDQYRGLKAGDNVFFSGEITYLDYMTRRPYREVFIIQFSFYPAFYHLIKDDDIILK